MIFEIWHVQGRADSPQLTVSRYCRGTNFNFHHIIHANNTRVSFEESTKLPAMFVSAKEIMAVRMKLSIMVGLCPLLHQQDLGGVGLHHFLCLEIEIIFWLLLRNTMLR